MPRKPRVTVLNTPHHVFQRTLNNRVIFYTDTDREKYLEILAEKAHRYHFDILAYCLMRTTVHIVGIPRRKDALTKTIGRTNFSYTHYINFRRERSGQLWRNRFMSCALDDNYLKIVTQYVETQPVRAKLVRKAERYSWSSAAAHVTGNDDINILSLDVWPSPRSRKGWSAFLKQKLDDNTIQTINTYTQTGRPLGTQSFIEKLEKKFRTRLHPLPVGRPRKS